MIKTAWPRFEADEIDAVTGVLSSGRVNTLHHGDFCRSFEKQFAGLCDARHGIALGNGTLALELALLAFGIGPGDEVVVTPRSFIASVACVINRGATPVFADVDRESQNLTAETVRAVLSPRTKAILPVHLAGWPCDMDALMALAAEKNLILIEDCAQAHGAAWNGRPVGGIGHAGAFSFCTDKIMSTGGEGGMLVLNDDAAWRRAWSYKDHGKSYDLTHAKPTQAGFRWIHDDIGSNMRITEMQCAIGVRQLAKLSAWVAARRANAGVLNEMLANVPGLRLALPPGKAVHAYYKYYVFVRPDRLKPDWTRQRILETLIAAGLPAGTGVCPEIYREEALTRRGLGLAEPLPVARELGETSLMFPCDHTMSPGDMAAMGEIIRKTMIEASV